jgi:CubicO group peptidase (beta-lactamase class C family)
MKSLLTIALVATTLAAGIESTPAEDTTHLLETFRKKDDFPALAVIVVKDGKICDRAAVGVRKLGEPTLVTTNDVFQINSCTKSMTATLAAVFIEEGKLRWDTSIAEVFPELKGKMNKQYENVTIEQLLTHRGGVPTLPPVDAIKRAFEAHGHVPEELRPAALARFGTFDFSEKETQRTPVEQRREFIEAVLVQSPEAAPGTQIIYSNQGYAIVGAMLEKIAGKSWEDLMAEKLFNPLHMDTAGFGVPGTIGKVDQPWGHTIVGRTVKPVQYDNPPVIAPAGAVHCSLDDLARFTIAHLQGEKNGGLLKPETFRRLHTPPEGSNTSGGWLPPGGNYACGWICANHDWAGGRTLYHAGANMWKMIMWLAPEKNFSVIVVTNFDRPGNASAKTEDECNEVADALIKKWLVN